MRELENIIERAVILTDGCKLQLDEALDLNTPPTTRNMKTLSEVEQEMIRTALKDCDWKIEGDSGAATRLAMAPIPPSASNAMYLYLSVLYDAPAYLKTTILPGWRNW